MSSYYIKKMPANTKVKPPKHWTQRVHEIVVSRTTDGSLNFTIKGGADNGQFPYIADVRQDRVLLRSGKLYNDEVILEINGYNVSGYTLWDIHGLVSYIDEKPLVLKAVKPGQHLTKDLRRYLNTRFQKGSTDHDLQQIIRDNLYLRTVPCTTRTPRNGEISGIDYTFLTVDEFMALEKSGNLLESGIFDGNHYGTPKPPKEPPGNMDPPIPEPIVPTPTTKVDVIKPGAHPSSKGKRERNKSSILATQNLTFIDDEEDDDVDERRKKESERLEKELGPLPGNWEIAFTEQNDMYFIDHRTETTQWLDPRLERVQKQALLDCADDELPYGWEKIEDPQYGSYYIDHINRRTQYENPVTQAKREAREAEGSLPETDHHQDELIRDIEEKMNIPNTDYRENEMKVENRPPEPVLQSQTLPRPPKKPMVTLPRTNSEGNIAPNSTVFFTDNTSTQKPFFTRNPAELKGEVIEAALKKSMHGFGFTIVGGDEPQEFLQIKSVVPNGPAFQDGRLETGDVLVFVNDTLVLGYTHQDVVKLFQSIGPGQEVIIQVCRGYPLPFDPEDANYPPPPSVTAPLLQLSRSTSGSRPMETNNIRGMQPISTIPRNHIEQAKSEPLQSLRDNTWQHIDSQQQQQQKKDSSKIETLTMNIVKGALGFGFTIADSPYGQKVKQILDEPRCKNLSEGDVLAEINAHNLRNLHHNEVVNILKKCPKGVSATITVQRGGMLDSPPTLRRNFPAESLFPKEAVGSHSVEIPRNLNTTPMFYQASAVRTPSMSSNTSKLTSPSVPDKHEFETGQQAYRSPSPELDQFRRGTTPSSISNNNAKDKPYRSPSPLKIITPPTNIQENRPPSRSHQPILKTSTQDNFMETTIFLKRQESGFGFRIVGGHEEGSQVSVGAIINNGAADLDGRLLSGDEILYCDGHSVIGSSHHKVVSMMGTAALAGRVSLGIRRRIRNRQNDNDNRGTLGRSYSVSKYPYDVTVNRREDEGFGFVIISATNKSGSTIGRLIENSPAERSGKLHIGDNLVAVNGINIVSMHHSEVVNIIKDSGYSVTLTIAAPDDASSSSSSPRSSEHMLNAMALPAQINDTDPNARKGYLQQQQQQQQQQLKSPDARYGINEVSNHPRNPTNNNFNEKHSLSPTIERRMYRDNHSSEPHYPNNRRYQENTPNNVDVRTPAPLQLGEGFYTASALRSPRSPDKKPGHQQDRFNQPTTKDTFYGQNPRQKPSHPLSPNNYFQFDNQGEHMKSGDAKPLTFQTFKDFDPQSAKTGRSNDYRDRLPSATVPRTQPSYQDTWQREIVEKHKAEVRRKEENQRLGQEQFSPKHNVVQQSQFSPQYKGLQPSPYSPKHTRPTGYQQKANTLEYSNVELLKGPKGFGFSIRGGKEFNDMPLFVLKIADDGAAALDGKLRVGDQIMEINGYRTTGMKHSEAIDIIKRGGGVVRLLVRRGPSSSPSSGPGNDSFHTATTVNFASPYMK